MNPFFLFQESLENVEDLTVYPTFIVGNEVKVYFERTYICKCSNVVQATATVVMLYYVFDVQYPAELGNTFNFLDSCVGRKSSVSCTKKDELASC